MRVESLLRVSIRMPLCRRWHGPLKGRAATPRHPSEMAALAKSGATFFSCPVRSADYGVFVQHCRPGGHKGRGHSNSPRFSPRRGPLVPLLLQVWLSRVLMKVGPTISAAAVSEALAFAVGVTTNIPALTQVLITLCGTVSQLVRTDATSVCSFALWRH